MGSPDGYGKLPSPLGRGCPAAGAFTSRSGTGEGSVGTGVKRSVKQQACSYRGLRSSATPTKTMQRIRNKIVTDEAQQPIAVQIDYADWLRIERSLNLPQEDEVTDLSRYIGVISLTEEPLAYQARVRSEWS
jgi:hypothetical protein